MERKLLFISYGLNCWEKIKIIFFKAKNMSEKGFIFKTEILGIVFSVFDPRTENPGWGLNSGAKEKLHKILLFSGMSWSIWLDVMWWADLNNKCNQWHKKGYCLYACICDWTLLALCVIWPLSVHFLNCLIVVL